MGMGGSFLAWTSDKKIKCSQTTLEFIIDNKWNILFNPIQPGFLENFILTLTVPETM